MALSIVSLFLVNHLRAQTGRGCFSSTCPTPGQIRLDAVVEYGELVAGCNCACDPALYDMNSPRYCAEPNAVNFDPDTLQGDCSCGCDMFGGTRPSDCVFPTQWDGSICDCACPVWAPDPRECIYPTEFVEELCQCACPGLGSVGGPCVVSGQLLAESVVTPQCTCNRFGNVQCPGNREPDPQSGECICPTVSQSGAYFPVCESPLIQHPTTCDCVFPAQPVNANPIV